MLMILTVTAAFFFIQSVSLLVLWWKEKEKAGLYKLMMGKALEREERLWKESTEERRELLTRIQAWEPAPKESLLEEVPSKAAKSQDGESIEESCFTSAQLMEMGLAPNSDGGVVDRKTSVIYESVEDWKEWIGYLRKRNLPMDLDPRIYQEEGVQAAMAARVGSQSGVKGA